MIEAGVLGPTSSLYWLLMEPILKGVVGLKLDRFNKALSLEDRALLSRWFNGQLTLEHSDPFPKMYIRPNVKDCERTVLNRRKYDG